MKIIDLLNKIANGEQPNHIIFDTDDWYWGYDSYIPKNFLETSPDVQATVSLFKKYRIDYSLNDEIEIINEQEKLDSSKKIENISIRYTEEAINNYKNANFNSNDMEHICRSIGFMMSYINEIDEKLNEVIDYINGKENNNE